MYVGDSHARDLPPPLATLALTVAFGASAFAQAPPAPTTRIRGTITSFAGSVLTVQAAATTYKVTIPDNARVSWVVRVS